MGPLGGVPVLVTGAGGFIGSHLVEALLARDARVRVLCRYTARGTLGWLEALPPADLARLDVRLGDVRDAGLVDACCEGVAVLFHLAALISIPYSYVAPESFLDTNVRGTLNVLEGARRAGVGRVVHTSTSEVYGTAQALPIGETHPVRPQSPYAASKAAADHFALAHHAAFGVPVVVVRPFNTYGPRQSARAVVPTILAQLLAGHRPVRLGRLDTRRDLSYVTDTVDALVRAAVAPGVEGQVVQLGTGRAVSIGELVALASRVLGVDAPVALDPARLRPEASEIMALQSDPARAHRLLGWQARVDLADGLVRTAAWLGASPERLEARAFHV